MKHKEYYEDYNEVMYDERDEIKRFLDKLNSIKGQRVWHFDSPIDMMAANGARVQLRSILSDYDRFVLFYVEESMKVRANWECFNFAYGELSKVIDALPEWDELLPDVMDTHNAHNAELVRKINAAWKSEKYHLMFGDILYAIGCRDNQEIHDKYDVIVDCNEVAMDYAHEIMEGVCDDLDLQTILSFIRYEED